MWGSVMRKFMWRTTEVISKPELLLIINFRKKRLLNEKHIEFMRKAIDNQQNVMLTLGCMKSKILQYFQKLQNLLKSTIIRCLRISLSVSYKRCQLFCKNAQEGECFENGEMSMGDRIFTCSGLWYYFLRCILVSQTEFLIYRWLPEGINAIWSKIPYSFRFSLMSALSNYNYYVLLTSIINFKTQVFIKILSNAKYTFI